MKTGLFIEVGPILELNYTGIANVTAAVCEYWLQRDDFDVFFFYEHMVIDPAEVGRAVEIRCGAPLRCQLAKGKALLGYVEQLSSKYARTAGLFCNVKTILDQFDFEFQIIYDLTFLLTPEFHHTDTILYHGLTLTRDLRSNKQTFCISDCTKDDVAIYGGVSMGGLSVHYPGIRPAGSPNGGADRSSLSDGLIRCGKYIVIVGTIEPRKNVDLILAFLADNPRKLDEYAFVFIGRSGWLTNFRDALEKHGLSEAFGLKRIIWLNFVSDYERDVLYKHAALTIYASLYEGFGLPVVEAMTFGCPVLASFAASIPEAGGDAAVYFDPLSLQSLKDAFARFEASDKTALRDRSLAHSRNFSWDRFNGGMHRAILDWTEAVDEVVS